ncbi:Transmembrane domain-containing protein [Spironucleus salmonicida]|uniref:Transmembrane domain-containing protein n=1 Tax=Spironucleus salmonicida TaxID=348837 RepID=A0A9P8LJI5_9EUKA|nr:Transmembrane domain-containing protein [Spironucleus salmonicida]
MHHPGIKDRIQSVFGITCACTYQQEQPSQCTVYLGSQVNIYYQDSSILYKYNSIYQISLQAPLPMHHTTKLHLRYYYIYYSIVLSSSTIPVPLTPAVVLSMEILGVPYWWYPLQQQAGITHRIYKQSSAQPVLVLYRQEQPSQATVHLGSQVNIYQQAQQYILQIQQQYIIYPYRHHSQCIYTTKLHLRYYYIYYSIVLSSSTIPVPLTPAVVLSMEILGVPYWWYPLQQQIVIKDRIQTVFGIACACTLQQEYPSQCTVHLGSQVNIYQQGQQYIIQIQQQYAKYPYSTTPNAYILLNSNQDITIYTIVLYNHPALCSTTHAYRGAVYGNTWGPVLVVPTSVAARYYTQNIQSVFGTTCACTLLVRIAFLGYCVPGLISEYILLRVVLYSRNTIVICQISLQAPLPMHIYYQTPFKILYIYYSIVQSSSTMQYHSRLPWCCLWKYLGSSTSGTQFTSRQVLHIEYTNSLRHNLCLYSTSKNSLLSDTVYLGSQVNIYYQGQCYILEIQQQYAKYPYKHHSQCIYTTKLQLRYYYIYYSIVQSSSTMQYHSRLPWCCLWKYLGSSTSGTHFSSSQVLHIEYTISLRHNLCLYSTSKNSLLSDTVYLGSQVNIYYQGQCYILEIQQQYAKYPYKHHSQCIYTTKLQLRYYYIYYSIVQSSSTMQYHSRLPWCCLWKYLGSSTSGTHFSSSQVLHIEYTISLRHNLCLYSTSKNSLLSDTVYLGSQVNIYYQGQCYILEIQQQYAKYPYKHHSQCIYTTKLHLRYYIYTIVLYNHPALCSTTHAYRGAVYGNTWGPVLVVPTSVAARYYTQNIQSVFGTTCACTLLVRIAFLVILCTWAHK